MMTLPDLFSLEWWEMASYVITVIGLPYAIALFWYESRRERQNDEEEIYLTLADEYAKFSRLLLEHADLRLMTGDLARSSMLPEQQERQKVIFDILISLFERAFVLIYEPNMNKQQARLWITWDDYISFWLARADFKAMLPDLLQGEDEDFVAYMQLKTKAA